MSDDEREVIMWLRDVFGPGGPRKAADALERLARERDEARAEVLRMDDAYSKCDSDRRKAEAECERLRRDH